MKVKTDYKIYDDQAIPDFSDKTPGGLQQWWRDMLEKGLYIHPSDGAENYVDSETGASIMSDNAAAKVNAIYAEMFRLFGEEQTCEVGTSVWWHYQGYQWDEAAQEFVKSH